MMAFSGDAVRRVGLAYAAMVIGNDAVDAVLDPDISLEIWWEVADTAGEILGHPQNDEEDVRANPTIDAAYDLAMSILRTVESLNR